MHLEWVGNEWSVEKVSCAKLWDKKTLRRSTSGLYGDNKQPVYTNPKALTG